MRLPSGNTSVVTVISFFVSVPVLSLQMMLVDPSVSTAARRRTMAPRRAMRCMPTASAMVIATGSPSGTIDTISINTDGELVASFGAGKSMVVAQLALATFNNQLGMVKLGSNRFGASDAAGQPNIGGAGTGGRGTVVGNTLEQSNVDIAQEFTQMILAQRGYQANSKSITVADEVLQDTLALKR